MQSLNKRRMAVGFGIARFGLSARFGRSSRSRNGQSLARRRRLFVESLETRQLLTASTFNWDTEMSFDQFSGGAAKVLAIGYNNDGSENPEVLGYDFCRASSCGGSPFSVGAIGEGLFGDEYGGEAELSISGRIGLEYGFYANAGTADLLYDGTFSYDVQEPASGPIDLATSFDILSGALFTQSPTVRAFVDMVLIIEGTVSGKGCFVACTGRGSTSFSVDERIPLFSLNRNADGEIKFVGEGLLEEAIGTADQLSEARNTKQEAARDQYKAQRDRATAKTASEYQQASQDLNDANQKSQNGANQEQGVKDRANSRASGKKFGGGEIIQVSVGEDPSDLLGVELEVGVGVGWKEAVDISKRLGSFSVTLPDIALTDTQLDANDRLSAETEQDDDRRNLAKLSLDLGAILGGGYGLGTTAVTLGPLSIELTTVSYDLDTSLRVNQEVEAAPKSNDVRLDFANPVTGNPVAINATVNGVARNNVTSLTFDVGDAVKLTPIGTQEVRVTPSLLQSFNFNNDLGLDLDISGTLRALALKLEAFGETLLDLPPLLKRTDPLGAFELGSVFENNFDVTADTISFPPFVIGGVRDDLSVTVTGGEEAETGDLVKYGVAVQNAGPSNATGVKVTTTLPSQFQFNAAESSASCSAVGQLVTCDVGQVNVGATQSRTIAAVPSIFVSDTFQFDVTVTGNERDFDLDNNTFRVETGVHRPVVFFVDISGDFPPGSNLVGCPTSQSGSCSLREAIREANETPGRDVILLTNAFSYGLTFGEIEITDAIDIIGIGNAGSRIDAERSRIFRINVDNPGGTEEENTVRIKGVEFRNGTGQEGTEESLTSVHFDGSSSFRVNDAQNRLSGFFVSDFTAGQLVYYDSDGGPPIPGLQSGTTYQVLNPIPAANSLESATIQLGLPGSNTPINIAPA
ncbi:MAG: DUF11 domain-containing protein, partial [Planctomycetales bacterium]|nr:DUF11 domain-containing protein [Planctomycetales bacterium]